MFGLRFVKTGGTVAAGFCYTPIEVRFYFISTYSIFKKNPQTANPTYFYGL